MNYWLKIEIYSHVLFASLCKDELRNVVYFAC